MKLILTSTLTKSAEIIKLEGNALTTPINIEDLFTYIREFAAANEVTEFSVSYEVQNEDFTSQAASTLGKLGGSAKTEAKSIASRTNGKLGGRPKKQGLKELFSYQNDDDDISEIVISTVVLKSPFKNFIEEE